MVYGEFGKVDANVASKAGENVSSTYVATQKLVRRRRVAHTHPITSYAAVYCVEICCRQAIQRLCQIVEEEKGRRSDRRGEGGDAQGGVFPERRAGVGSVSAAAYWRRAIGGAGRVWHRTRATRVCVRAAQRRRARRLARCTARGRRHRRRRRLRRYSSTCRRSSLSAQTSCRCSLSTTSTTPTTPTAATTTIIHRKQHIISV
jgi:hypothetical protein